MKVLITCGPTWVPIDQVRVISNISTGKMGHLIADAFSSQGASVTVLEGPCLDHWTNAKVSIIHYRFFDELDGLLKKLLKKKFDVVIHAAAVSDFKVINASKIKFNSSKSLTLKLSATKKLIDSIKIHSPRSLLVGFKLESTLEKAIQGSQRLIENAGCDLVIANSLNKIYRACLVDRTGKVISRTNNKKTLAEHLVAAMMYHFNFVKRS